jgi:hypothetical protein
VRGVLSVETVGEGGVWQLDAVGLLKYTSDAVVNGQLRY